jgi:hypothetical protein
MMFLHYQRLQASFHLMMNYRSFARTGMSYDCSVKRYLARKMLDTIETEKNHRPYFSFSTIFLCSLNFASLLSRVSELTYAGRVASVNRSILFLLLTSRLTVGNMKAHKRDTLKSSAFRIICVASSTFEILMVISALDRKILLTN